MTEPTEIIKYQQEKMAKNIIIIAIIAMSVLVGCELNSSSGPQYQNMPSVQASVTFSSSTINTESAKTPVDTLLPDSTKLVNTPGVTKTPDNNEQAQEGPTTAAVNNNTCVNTKDSSQSKITGVNGKIVLINRMISDSNNYLLDIENGKTVSLPTQDKPYLFNASVTPDGQWLGYEISSKIYKDDLLIVVTSSGKVEKQISLAPANDAWKVRGHEKVGGWLDNNRLIIGYGNIPGPEAVTLILNPFTDKWDSYQSNYPGLFTTVDTSPFWEQVPLTRAVFHPSLDLVVYPSYEGIVLWDLLSKHAVVTLSDNIFLAKTEPIWAPDGSSFIVDLFSSRTDPNKFSDRNLFQVFPDGEVKQLTSLSDRLAGDFVDYAWSPNSESVAFWISSEGRSENQPTYRLAVLDILSHNLKQYCIYADLGENQFPRSSPVWSPDSKYIVVSKSIEGENDRIESVLINLSNNELFNLGNDIYPVGWMTQP